jgi:hypothetical protein
MTEHHLMPQSLLSTAAKTRELQKELLTFWKDEKEERNE